MDVHENSRPLWWSTALAVLCVTLFACGGESPTEPPLGGDPPGADPPGGDPDDPDDPPGNDPPAPLFVQVATGSGHTCALNDAGEISCWGRNEEGQLGTGTAGADELVPVPVESGLEFVAVAAGDFHTCALDDTGAAHCWGDNGFGQLGDGTIEPRPVPTPLDGSLVFTALTVGSHHGCGLVTGTDVRCWGKNSAGQLGTGDTNPSSTPVQVDLSSLDGQIGDVIRIDAGGGHTCGIDSNGAALCWGNNGTGQLGDSTTTQRNVPVLVLGGSVLDFETVSAGATQTCAEGGGVAQCWGFNLFGQLGDGTNTNRHGPTLLAVDLSLSLLTAGSDHTCGVTPEGIAYCWGLNGGGRLGDGTTDKRNEPTPVAGEFAFTDISAGVVHTCGVTTDGEVYCWGGNVDGQLGTGDVEGSAVPVQVVGS